MSRLRRQGVISLALTWMMFVAVGGGGVVLKLMLISIGEGGGVGKKVNCRERFSVLISDSDSCGSSFNEEDDEKVCSSEGVAGAHTLSPQVAFSARLDTSNNKPNQERTCWRIKLKCNNVIKKELSTEG